MRCMPLDGKHKLFCNTLVLISLACLLPVIFAKQKQKDELPKQFKYGRIVCTWHLGFAQQKG